MEQINKYLIVTGILFLFLLLLISYSTYNISKDTKETIEICKELGYDGARSVNGFTLELECYNQTELEKIKEARRESQKH